MRIVGGDLKGRPLSAPEGLDVRPTSDRAREAVFNILLNGKPDVDFTDAVVLDAFCGTGALGLEAISRGAREAIFIDTETQSLACVSHNAKSLGVLDKCLTFKINACKAGAKLSRMSEAASLVLLDPPYDQNLEIPALESLAENGWIAPDACVVLETSKKTIVSPPKGYELIDARRYGMAQVTFLRFMGL